MREIKFRAWDNLAGYVRMIYDGFSIVASGDPVGFFVEPDITPNTTRICGEWRGDSTIIIMQYTGLKDKNGKEIYEGDIVQIKHPYKKREWSGRIVYGGARFQGDGFYFPHFDDPTDLFSEGTDYIEVIGNIYENPELLKEA